jgi:hypothetical protein
MRGSAATADAPTAFNNLVSASTSAPDRVDVVAISFMVRHNYDCLVSQLSANCNSCLLTAKHGAMR